MLLEGFTYFVLPPELVYRVLDYLPKADIRRAAQISRYFRKVSVAHSRFFIPLEVRTVGSYPDYNSRLLAKMDDIIGYAVKHNIQIGLLVEICHVDRAFLAHIPRIMSQVLSVAVRIIYEQSLPEFDKVILEALRAGPASRLRSLIFDGIGSCILPLDIFQGNAPRLTRIKLGSVCLRDAPVPAFHNVHVLTTDALNEGELSKVFPCLKSLGIKCLWYKDILNLSGLKFLRHLELHRGDEPEKIYSTLETVLPLTAINTIAYRISYSSDSVFWNGDNGTAKAIWKDIGGPLTMDLGHGPVLRGWRPESLHISVQELKAPYRRRVYVQNGRGPLKNLVLVPPVRHLLSVIVDIHAASYLLGPLIKVLSELSTLQRLKVDLVCRHNSDHWGNRCANDEEAEARSLRHATQGHTVACPRLDVVSVYAKTQATDLDPIDVAHIGHALGQLSRPPNERARLDLFGVQLDSNHIVSDVFRCVACHDFSPMHQEEASSI